MEFKFCKLLLIAMNRSGLGGSHHKVFVTFRLCKLDTRVKEAYTDRRSITNIYLSLTNSHINSRHDYIFYDILPNVISKLCVLFI